MGKKYIVFKKWNEWHTEVILEKNQMFYFKWIF